MDEITNQLRAYAQELRSRGVPKEEARRLLQDRERSLRSAPAQPAEREEPGLSLGQRAALAAQGATFGFGEELLGLGRGALAALPGGKSPREAYEESVEASRRGIERAYREAPVQSIATEMAGGFVPGLLAAPFTGGGSVGAAAARAATMAPRITGVARTARNLSRASAAKPIVGGAIEGAISGAGAAEGDLETRAVGAGFGAVAGGLTGGLIRGAGATGRRIGQFREDVGLQREAQRLSEQMRASGVPYSEGQAFSELVQQRMPRGITTAAMEDIEQALLQQGIEPARAASFARPGQTVMELGVPSSELAAIQAGMPQSSAAATPIQRIARRTSVVGGEPGERVRRTIAERLMESPERVRAELTSRVAPGRIPYLDAVEEMTQGRKARANELYEAAYQQSIPVERLSQFIERSPETNWFAQLYRRAQSIADQEVAEGIEGAQALPEVFEFVNERIQPIRGAQVPVKAADYIQRAMREEIEAGFKGREGSVQLSRIRNVGVNNFLKEVDSIVPDFAAARKIYRNDSADIAAFDTALNGGTVSVGGRPIKMKRFLQERPEVIRRFLENPETSQSERQRYIEAALESLLQKSEQIAPGRDITRVLFSNEAMRDRVRLLLGSEGNFKDFVQAVLPERGLKNLEAKALGGSVTMDKAADLSIDRARAGETAVAAASGAGALAARIFAGVVDSASNRFSQAVESRGKRAMSSQLLTMSPQSFQDYYTNVYRPTMSRGDTLQEVFSQAARRATGGQLSRMLGREF